MHVSSQVPARLRSLRCRYPQAFRRHRVMCPHSQPVRLNGISSRRVRAAAAALRVRVRVVLVAQRAHGPAARRTSPVAGAAGVEAAASPAAAGVAVHWTSQRVPRR